MNCIIVDDEAMSREAVKKLVEKTGILTLVGECRDASEAKKLMLKEHVDIVFLDVQMPGMSGLEFIRTLEQKPFFILTTGKKDYAMQAFEENVLDYLLKPIQFPRFFKSVERAINAIQKKGNPQASKEEIFIKAEPGRLVKIKASEIMFVEALADYVIINKANEKFTVHTTMKNIETKLPQNDFVRVHRSFIVRLDKITEMEENTLTVNKNLIPIGRSYRNDLISRLNFI